METRNKYRVLNLIFYLLLAYQFVILILGNVQYVPLGHVHDGLYAFSFMFIYLYILTSKTKEACIKVNCIRQKWFTGDIDKDEAERMYYLQKRIILVLAILFSTLAVILAFINIIQNFLVLFKYILSYIGISALVILILTITLGIKTIIRFIQKPWKKDDMNPLFNMLILQNFLISTSILKMLSNIRG